MFREMRRAAQQLPEDALYDVLQRAQTGVLAVQGDGGYPYAVPLNFLYADGKIYFHCAREGHKLDAIRRDPKVSFCVVDADEVIAEKYTTAYRSVIAFGRARIMEDDQAIFDAIDRLAMKYVPDDSAESRHAEMRGGMPKMAMVEMEIKHICGKESMELVRLRGK